MFTSVYLHEKVTLMVRVTRVGGKLVYSLFLRDMIKNKLRLVTANRLHTMCCRGNKILEGTKRWWSWWKKTIP